MKMLAALAVAWLALLPAAARAANVGFQEVRVPNGADRPLVVGIWYPTDATASPQKFDTSTQDVAPAAPVAGKGLPLVVMSHGNGGWYGGHQDTSMALAKAGFVAAAVSHTGDTYDDKSRQTRMQDRPAHIKRLIDYMVNEWPGRDHIDANRIGVFGFSSGGFTALVAAGATPHMQAIRRHCEEHPDVYDCNIVKHTPPALMDQTLELSASAWAHDPRIKAAVVAAPALGFSFGKDGLAGVTVPVQLWRAENDHILPNPDYAEAVRANLPQPPEYHVVANADHYDFLAPCDARLAQLNPDICKSAPGFDRTEFHADFDRKVVAFFERTLK